MKGKDMLIKQYDELFFPATFYYILIFGFFFFKDTWYSFNSVILIVTEQHYGGRLRTIIMVN